MDISPEPGDIATDTTAATLDNLGQLALSGAAAEEYLSRHNPGALLLDPAEQFRSALVGVTRHPNDHWPRTTDTLVAVYSTDAVIEALIGQGMSYEGACEWFSYNTSGSWLGEGTPTFV